MGTCAWETRTDAWVRYASTIMPTIFAGALKDMLLESGAPYQEADAAEKEVWETFGGAREGMWWNLIAAWGQKAHEP